MLDAIIVGDAPLRVPNAKDLCFGLDNVKKRMKNVRYLKQRTLCVM